MLHRGSFDLQVFGLTVRFLFLAAVRPSLIRFVLNSSLEQACRSMAISKSGMVRTSFGFHTVE